MSALFYTHIDDSPVGPLLLAGDSDALHVLSFGRGSRPREIDEQTAAQRLEQMLRAA